MVCATVPMSSCEVGVMVASIRMLVGAGNAASELGSSMR
jgi:hypothetical protein